MQLPDTLPKGYTALPEVAALAVKARVNVIGFVIDSMESKLTGKGEWMTTFTLSDYDIAQSGVQVRFFRTNKEQLPVPLLDDIVVVKNLTRMDYRGVPMLCSSHHTITHIMSQDSIPSPDFAQAYTGGKQSIICVNLPSNTLPEVDAQLYAMFLKARYGKATDVGVKAEPIAQSTHIQTPAKAPTLSTKIPPTAVHRPGVSLLGRSQKFSLIQDVQPDKFYDMVVEMVKLYPSRFGDSAEVYVTDYTVNDNLFNYPDPEDSTKAGRDGDDFAYISTSTKNWPGPWGKRVLCVEVRYPHLAYLQQHVKVGDCVELKNVRVKHSRQTRLEGNMFPDNRTPEKILVAKVDARKFDSGMDILERKEAYWGNRRPPEAKTTDKKMSKRAEKRKKAEEIKRKEEKREIQAAGAVIVNRHIRCTHSDVPYSTLSSMLALRGQWRTPDNTDEDLPFLNQRRRCPIRVVDYYPPDLREFTCPAAAAPATEDPMDVDMDASQPNWIWNFFLLVQDASQPIGKAVNTAQTWVHVSDNSAQYMLKLDACDLKEDDQTCLKLRDKVEILWGNLRELKEGAAAAVPVQVATDVGEQDIWSGRLANVPFECCLQEYGQHIDDEDTKSDNDDTWIRLFGMFETTIL